MPNPPPIDADLVAYLGELARLSLPEQRQEALRTKLQALVEAFSTLETAALGEAGSTAPDAATVRPETLRPDVPEPVPSAADVLQNAPQTAADSFVVPRVVEP
jgi:aspartyl/glutamyl-tRNA(Asn/Gln) amidotransferase C subunit